MKSPPSNARNWASLRNLVHIMIIIFSICCIVLSLVPIRERNDRYVGETYVMFIDFTAGLSIVPFMCLFLSVGELAARAIRPGNVGIHPFWFFGLAIFCTLAAWIAAIINSVRVGLKMQSKNNVFENWWRDTCENRGLWGTDVECMDGFYDNEALYISLCVLGFALAVAESVLSCFMTRGDVRARKEQRRAARAGQV